MRQSWQSLVAALLLILLGVSSTVGYVTHQPWLQRYTKLSAAAPLGLAFTQVQGIDTFAILSQGIMSCIMLLHYIGIRP